MKISKYGYSKITDIIERYIKNALLIEINIWSHNLNLGIFDTCLDMISNPVKNLPNNENLYGKTHCSVYLRF